MSTTDIYNLDLEDIDFKESSSATLNPCKQYDDIILNLNLFQDGEPIDLSKFTVDLRVLKNDNSFVIQDETKGITKTNNTLKIECIKSVTNVAGKAKCEIRLVNSNAKQKTSFNFVLPIKPSVINDNSIDTSSVVTIVETLNTNIDSARQWHTTLENDIEVAVPLQASLHKDIQDANTFRIQFNKDVTEGKELYPKLHSDIAEGKELDNTLNTSMNNAKENINLIRSSGNPHFEILASDWITNTDTSSTLGYMKDITHNLETQNIIINAFDITTGMEIFPNVKRIDNNTLRFFNDNNIDGIKVILSARYYDGGSDIGDEVKGARKTFETIGKRFDDIDSHLEDIAPIIVDNYKHLTDIDDTNCIIRAIENAIEGQKVLFPKSKYYISETIIISKNVTLLSENKTVLYNTSNATTVHIKSTCCINGLSIEYAVRDHHQLNKIGILIEDKNASDYNYVQNVMLNRLTLEKCTYSIKIEKAYYITLNDIVTAQDMFGCTLNKDFGTSSSGIGTTIKLINCYFKGSQSSTQSQGSYGLYVVNSSDLSMTNCISEWYDNLGYFKIINCVTIINQYLEYGLNSGFEFNTVANIVNVNPYTSSVSNFAFKIDYSSMTLIGGRGILSEGNSFISKRASSKLYITSLPVLAGGTLIENNGYQSQNVITIDGGMVFDTTIDGITFASGGIGNAFTKYLRTGIQTKLNNDKFNIKIGNVNVGDYTAFGFEYAEGKTPILTDVTTKEKYKITVNNGAIALLKI